MQREQEAVELAYRCLVGAGVEVVVALPDSILSPLCKRIKASDEIRYIQTIHEAIAVAVATGITLTGTRTLVLMENSGLRNACETIARYNLSHNLYTVYLISERGAFGERNWWGLAHYDTMEPLLKMLHFRWDTVWDLSQFKTKLEKCYSTADADQCSVALIVHPDLLRGLKDAD